MSCGNWAGDLSEDEELMFAFEEHADAFSPRLSSGTFHSIDGVAFERPANPMAAVLDSKKRGREEDEDEDTDEPEALDDADLVEEKPLALFSRKTFELPSVPARVVRPVAKRFKSNAHERSITAPACLMGGLPLHRTRESKETVLELENEADNGPLRSASITIPASFQPIHWPGDAAVVDRSQSCSSSSSSKSWASGIGSFCRRSLDVPSPLRVRLNDLVLHSSAGSYTGS